VPPPDAEPRSPLPHRTASRAFPVLDPEGAVAPRPPEDVQACVVDCALYRDGRRHGGRVPLEDALAQAEAAEEGFAWIGLHDPAPVVLRVVGEHFRLHVLAVEDAVHAHQRAKLDVYGDVLFCVLKTARYVPEDEHIDIGELMVFVGERFVVSVRHGEASPLDGVRADLEARPDLLGIGPSAVLYGIVDRVVDDYALVIDALSQDVDEIETEVFSGQSNPAERIYRLKREVLEFKRAVQPLLEPVQRLAARQTGLPLDPRTIDHFRDVSDHLVRDAERVAAFDELLTGVLHANLAQIAVRDNRDMRRISAWVAIIAVPTMVFGLYGMNFRHMPELEWRFGYPLVLLAVAAACALLFRKFRRAGWL
jgi:magnesium transporter